MRINRRIEKVREKYLVQGDFLIQKPYYLLGLRELTVKEKEIKMSKRILHNLLLAKRAVNLCECDKIRLRSRMILLPYRRRL